MITLFGFRGCGKSYLGNLVAQKLQWDFVDTDCLIEDLYATRYQRVLSYREIFQMDRALFRCLEKEVLPPLQGKTMTILAVGGGCVLDPDNCKQLLSMGSLIYLRISKDALEKRMEKDPPPYSFAECYEERKGIYESIPAHVVDVNAHAVGAILEIICGK